MTPEQEALREAIKDVLVLYGIRGEKLGSLRPGAVAAALLPVVERHARERAAEELRYRAEGITSRATEADSEDVQVALDDEAARLHARADALTREAQR